MLLFRQAGIVSGGYLSDPSAEIDFDDLKNDGIFPLRIDDENCDGVKGDFFSMTFSDRDNTLSSFENVWLPLPYFFKRTPRRFNFGPLNWSRCKLIPVGEDKGIKSFYVLLAFDTRSSFERDEKNECPVFPDAYREDMEFGLCNDEFFLMDYCSPVSNSSYIDEYLLHLVHPEVSRVSQLKGSKVRRMSYVASYLFLINYLSQNTTVHENPLTYYVTPYKHRSFKADTHSEVLNQLPLCQLTYCKQNKKKGSYEPRSLCIHSVDRFSSEKVF